MTRPEPTEASGAPSAPAAREASDPRRRAAAPGDGWATNIGLAHIALFVVGVVGQLVLLLVALVLGHGVGALVGILVGVPLFLTFPVLAERLVGRRWVLEREGSNPVGWGYFMLLGLASLFLVTLGGDAVPRLFWQLQATERLAVDLAEIERSAGHRTYFARPATLRILPEPIGHSRHSLHLGDSRRTERNVYLAPLADRGTSGPGCVWLAIEGRTNESRKSAVGRLLRDESPWLVQPIGLDRAGHAEAVRDALEAVEAPVDCDRPVVLTGARSRAEDVAVSGRTLAWMHALAHLLPLVILGGWALSRRFGSRDDPA